MLSPSVPPDGAIDNLEKPPKIYLLLENSHKANNLGTILRCAAAFGVTQVVTVGCNKCSTHGSHGAAKHVSRVTFPGMEQAVSYLRGECGCNSLVGILGGLANDREVNGYPVVETNDFYHVDVSKESTEKSTKKYSYPVHSRHFIEGNCCFVVNKKPKGLPISLASSCDFFIHIPHVSVTEDDNLCVLDIPSCLSIILHHFTSWANYDERGFQGHKYEKAVTQQLSVEAKEFARLGRLEVRKQQMEETDKYAVGVDARIFDRETNDDGDY
jgi:hypothetical protein